MGSVPNAAVSGEAELCDNVWSADYVQLLCNTVTFVCVECVRGFDPK